MHFDVPWHCVRTLALCIVSTVGSLLWTLVLLVLLFYTFGVPFRQPSAARNGLKTCRFMPEWP